MFYNGRCPSFVQLMVRKEAKKATPHANKASTGDAKDNHQLLSVSMDP